MLLALVTAVLSAWMVRRQTIRKAVSRLKERGARVTFHRSSFPWLHRWTRNFFANPSSVEFVGQSATDEDVQTVAALRSIESLSVPDASIGSKSFRAIARMPRLKGLSLAGSQCVDVAALGDLSKSNSLKALDIRETALSGNDLHVVEDFPCLNHMTCSLPSRNWDRTQWIRPENLQQLVSNVGTVALVGDCFLSGLNDSHLDALTSIDVSEVHAFVLSDCQFTRSGWAAFGKRLVKLPRLHLQRCNFSDADFSGLSKAIATLRISSDDSVRSVTPAGVIGYLPSVERFVVSRKSVQFTTASIPFSVSIDWSEPISMDVWKSSVAKGLRSVHLNDADHQHENLRTLAEINPSIELKLIQMKEVEDGLMARMTELEELEIQSPNGFRSGSLQFSSEHRLHRLQIRSTDEISEDTVLEIEKLPHLERLWIMSETPVEHTFVDRLNEMRNAKYISVYPEKRGRYQRGLRIVLPVRNEE